MNAAAGPSFQVIAGVAAAVLVVAALAFLLVARLPLERRVRFARFLGNAFLLVVVAAMILGIAAQYFR